MSTASNRLPTLLPMPASPLQRIEQLTGRLNKITSERELAIARDP
jgi:hypothetical protein